MSPTVGQLDYLQMLLLWYSLETFKSKMNVPRDNGATVGAIMVKQGRKYRTQYRRETIRKKSCSQKNVIPI